MYLVKPLSQDKGSGRYTMYLPLFALQFPWGERGRHVVYLPLSPCPEKGTLPDIWALPKHTSG